MTLVLCMSRNGYTTVNPVSSNPITSPSQCNRASYPWQPNYLQGLVVVPHQKSVGYMSPALVLSGATWISILIQENFQFERDSNPINVYIERVTFASGSCLKRIEKEAFSGCFRLNEIEIPASVEEIGRAHV